MGKHHDINNQDLIHRINRLVGHLQGVGRMINDNRSCAEVVALASSFFQRSSWSLASVCGFDTISMTCDMADEICGL